MSHVSIKQTSRGQDRRAISRLPLRGPANSPTDSLMTTSASFNDDDVFMHSQGVHSARQVDGITLQHPVTGAYYAISGSAAFIWDCLDEPCPLASVKNTTAERYAVSTQEVGEHIATFLSELSDEGLVTRTIHSEMEVSK